MGRIDYATRLLARQQIDKWLIDPIGEQIRQAQGPNYYELLAGLSEEEYMTMRRSGLLSSRRMRIREHRWYPNGGELFVEQYGDGYLYPEDKRALNLLRRFLTPEQWECLGKNGYFDVTVTSRTTLGRKRNHLFRIHTHCMVYEHKNDGRQHYCIMALEAGMPEWDWMLEVKMLIEGDLRKFYATAKTRGWQPVSCNQIN